MRTIRVCGPGAFIVLKALAFDKRGKPKDAYDLYYVLRNHPNGVERIGQRMRGFGDRSEVRDAASVLRRDFARVDAVGPTRVAESLGGPDDTLQADVAGFIRSLLESLT